MQYRNLHAKLLLLISGGLKGKRSQRDSLQEGPDIVIGTPGRLQELFEAKHLRMDRCQTLVMDEVDILRGEASLFRDQVPFGMLWQAKCMTVGQ